MPLLPQIAWAAGLPTQAAPGSQRLLRGGTQQPGALPGRWSGQSWEVGGVTTLAAAATVGFFTAVVPRRRRCHVVRRNASLAVEDGVDVESLVKTEEPPEDLREWRLKAKEKMLSLDKPWPAPKNDRLLRAARGEQNDRPPKWMMRQAGRYLPEYQAVLAKSDFFEVCSTPALAAEVTLQPYRRYPTLDSLIIFSDILVIPVAMGMKCHMEPAKGPQFDFALTTPEEMERLNLTPNVEETLGYVFDAVFWTRQRVQNEVPVIGFSGAPWTLMGYMVQGGAVRSFEQAKKWLYLYPEASRKLLRALRDIVIEYLIGKYDSGAPLLTIFDTNCGELPPRVYEEYCVEDLLFIAKEVKRRRPHALMTIFPKDGEIGVFNDSAYDVVGVSWTTSPAEARRQCPDKTLQGNLDPFLLYADPAQIHERAQRMAREFGVDRYIANLGHGMLPSHPVAGPKAFIEAIDGVLREEVGGAPAAAVTPSATATASSAPPPGPLLTLNLQDDTSVSVPCTQVGAEGMKKALAGFMADFKAIAASGKPQRREDFEFEWAQGDTRLEIFCNPNAFPTIFDVKFFLTIKCGEQVKISSEVPLGSLQADLEAFTS